MDKVRSEFEALKFHERCLNMAETRYWLQQYKQFAEKLVAALSSREGEAVGEIHDIDHHWIPVWTDGTPEPGTKLYAAPSARVAELEARIAALESQLAESREREGRMREAMTTAHNQIGDSLLLTARETLMAALAADKEQTK